MRKGWSEQSKGYGVLNRLLRCGLAVYVASAFILPAGCVRDTIDDGGFGQSGDKIEFAIGFAPGTRVATGVDFKSTWEKGDEIGVFAVENGRALSASDNCIHNLKLAFDGTSWTPEAPAYWPNDGEKLNFYAYYPYDGSAVDPTAIEFAVKTDQSAETDYNASDLLAARSDNGGNGYDKTTAVVPLTFSHALAMLQLTIDNSFGSIDPDAEIAVDLRGVRTSVILGLGAPEATASGDMADVTMCRVERPGTPEYAKDFNFRALVPVQSIEKDARMFLISNGNLLLISPALASPLTLSAGQTEMFAVILGDVEIQPESNSYMVEPDGKTIMIPVSRANAATDPDQNLGADATGLGGVTADNFTVELVWSDTPVGDGGVLRAIGAKSYKGQGYVYATPGVPGNAVVCIKVDGKIKWSWHIWVTEPVGQGTDPETGLTWMDRNLGAKSDTPLVNGAYDEAQWIKTLGLYYQWGRKDAFPSSDGTPKAGSNTAFNNQIYYTPTETSGTTDDLPLGSYTGLSDMVQNPLNFATDSGTYLGSLNEKEMNDSWGGISGEKTLYDPCPPGWRVPPIQVGAVNSWGVDNDPGWAAFVNKGRVFNGVNGTATLGHFYPSAGLRDIDDSLLRYIGSSGMNSSAEADGTQDCLVVSASEDLIITRAIHMRTYGCSVRCVAE